MSEIIAKVSKSVKVLLKSSHTDIDWEQPLYAINWFSTKMTWMYNLYNLLAFRSVTKVGGRAFFKGQISEVVLDQQQTARDFILIVRYPNGHSFKTLIESTFFKIISILRVLSVKDFTIGFTHKRTIDHTHKASDKLFYALHHFKSSDANEALLQQFESLPEAGIAVKYAGLMVAKLYSQREDKKPFQVPNLMDGLVLFEAQTKQQLAAMFASSNYQTLVGALDSSCIVYVNRIF